MTHETAGGHRTYRKRLRAEQEARTRLAITEAAVELHGSIGPARTTVAAIAARAGVQRATVYRHFPDAESLFMACSSHWASLRPLPEADRWRAIADPDERLREALSALYEWFAWGEPMLTNVLRDSPLIPAAANAGAAFARRFADLHAALMHGRRVRGRGRARVAAVIGHALSFETLRSLAREQGLANEDAVALMCSLVEVAAGRPGS